MQTCTREEFDRLVSGAAVLMRDSTGDKVYQTADGRIIKLFRFKRLLSSAWIRPYAVRFVTAAARLTALGFATVRVRRLMRVPHLRCHAVVYDRLEGITIREALAGAGDAAQLWRAIAQLMAELHQKGVYFRALHLGNLLVTPGESLALIDVSEARFQRRPLSLRARARNFKPIMRYTEDSEALMSFGIERYLDEYCRHAALDAAARQYLGTSLHALRNGR